MSAPRQQIFDGVRRQGGTPGDVRHYVASAGIRHMKLQPSNQAVSNERELTAGIEPGGIDIAGCFRERVRLQVLDHGLTDDVDGPTRAEPAQIYEGGARLTPVVRDPVLNRLLNQFQTPLRVEPTTKNKVGIVVSGVHGEPTPNRLLDNLQITLGIEPAAEDVVGVVIDGVLG